MRKAIVYLALADQSIVDHAFPDLPENSESFPPGPGEVHHHAQTAVKFYGDFLPESYECKEGERIQLMDVEGMRELIGGVK